MKISFFNLKKIHIQAFLVWIVYSVTSKLLFVKGVFLENGVLAYSSVGLASVFFSVSFLYLFSHEDFFKFAMIIENKEMKRGKKWLKIFKHTGKILTSFLIGLLAGSMITALTVRLLLGNMRYKYIFVGVVSLVSAIVWLGVARGVFTLVI